MRVPEVVDGCVVSLFGILPVVRPCVVVEFAAKGSNAQTKSQLAANMFAFIAPHVLCATG